MKVLLAKVGKVARSDAPVLIRGESGSGKELIANAVHRLSARNGGPLIKVNCAALPETLLESTLFGYVKGAFTGATADTPGLFQAADGGTLFLDEIGEVSPAFQPKLLRVLQNGEIQRVGEALRTVKVDVRVVAATHRDLEKAMKQGAFREDLYYRLNVVPLVVPSLTDRREDIPELIAHFAKAFAGDRDVRFSADAEWAFSTYEWPGNVRELANAIQHGIVLSDDPVIGLRDLPAALQEQNIVRINAEPATRDDPLSLEALEIRCLLQALAKSGGNRTRAAKLLGLTRRALCYRIQKYGLNENDVARPGIKVVRPASAFDSKQIG
jgi:transcriptional regulator with GAF, ATPase, and Fis domain